MKQIKTDTVFLVLFLLLTVAIVVIFLKNKKSIQTFATATEIEAELKKQYDIMNKFEFPEPNKIYGSASPIVPNMEIVKRYRDSANSLLGPIEESVTKDSVAKSAELSKMDDYIRSLTDYARNDYLKHVNNRVIQTVKSHNNGLELSVSKTDLGPKRDYHIRVNEGCLKVPFTNEPSVVPCNANDPDQVFSLDNVFNENEYRAKMDKAYPQLQDLGDVRYPFSVLRAKSNGNCLKNFHGSISVEPCREYEGQRWASTEKTGGLCPLR